VAVYFLGLLIILAGVYLYTLSPVGPLPEALPYLQSTDQVKVTTGRFAWFQPTSNPAKTGFIFYPGGRVDYRAYAPLASGLASKGWPVAVVPMPLDLAILGPDKAHDVINAHPEITHWVIGGHSLGGTMAAQFAAQNPSLISGIVFLASYPADKKLKSANLSTLAIFGENDGLVTAEDREKFRPRFPEATEWVVINGGNHAGFGWYGKQEDDNPASISLQEQGSQVLQSIDQFMKKMEDKK
jgi:pimeloyl-ACP methyl ester carboxylesterase